jgi:hypothetical protein
MFKNLRTPSPSVPYLYGKRNLGDGFIAFRGKWTISLQEITGFHKWLSPVYCHCYLKLEVCFLLHVAEEG